MAIREPGIVKGNRGVSADRRNTEAGLTKSQRETLERVEKEAGNLDREVLTIVAPDGSIKGQYRGNASSVNIPDSEDYKFKDAVVTHNHPGQLTTTLWGNTLATRIGQSLSSGDVLAAIEGDVKEIRAVTKGGYIYSLKRPAGGWGINKTPGWDERLANEFRSVEYRYDRQYLYKNPERANEPRSMAQEMEARVNTADGARGKILARHNTVKELANKYGWKYTRRRWKN